jgi:Ser-tRNA(Ala) deacylase AlaX
MNIDQLIEGIEPTVRSYWDFPKKRKQKGTVLKIACDKDFCYVILDKTLFHPETDEQEGDAGWIRGKNGELSVKNTLVRHGVIIHEGKMKGEFQINEDLEVEIYLPSRKKHIKMHALGHVVRASILEVKSGVEITNFRMSSPGFIHVKGGLTEKEVEKVRKLTAEKIKQGVFNVNFMDSGRFTKTAKQVPRDLPDSIIRVCLIGSEPMTCGGIMPDSIKTLDFKIVGMRGEKLIFDLE